MKKNSKRGVRDREGERNLFRESEFMEREGLGHDEGERFGQSKSG